MMNILPIVPIYTKILYNGVYLDFLAGLVISITAISNIFAAPVLGKIGDRIGQKKILIIAIVFSAVTLLPQALANNITDLLVGRFLLGFFIGGMIPSLNVLIKKMTPAEKLGSAFSMNISFLNLGNLFGPLLGSYVAAGFGIRSVFYITMGMFLFNAILLSFNKKLGKTNDV